MKEGKEIYPDKADKPWMNSIAYCWFCDKNIRCECQDSTCWVCGRPFFRNRSREFGFNDTAKEKGVE